MKNSNVTDHSGLTPLDDTESYRISIDVGGTFTDFIALNEGNRHLTSIKVPSTPRMPAVGVTEGLSMLLPSHKRANIAVLIHATTICTNALTGQLGLELPKTALVVTAGFRDVIEIGRQRRSELYNLFIQRPRMLIPRRRRYEVEERIDSEGKVITPLKDEDIRKISHKMQEDGSSSVAVAFLNSYINPQHEDEVKKVIEATCPNVSVTTSHEVSPEYREYERISTAVVNACLVPIFSTYITDLLENVRELKVEAPIYVMRSDGGVTTAELAKQKPVSVVESGPAAGVIAASFYGKTLSLRNIMSFDMGGTTAKAGLITDYSPNLVTEYEVGGKVHSGRIIKGSGYPIKFPFIDLSECSAGGGTIAWVDAGGALKVGPISAGAVPGPACYNLGGQDPTVTDANLVLGRLNPDYILGGALKVNGQLSIETIEEKICSRMGLNTLQAAVGIVGIVNSTMAKILRIVSVERGHDPRDFTLMAFGGAGPMHACTLAEDLGISKIVIPLTPGLFSAQGMLAADFKHHSTRPILQTSGEVDPASIEETYKEMEDEDRRIIEKGNATLLDTVCVRQVDMRYRGQAFELIVPTSKSFDKARLNQLISAFHEKHRSIYGYAIEGGAVELVNLRLETIGVTSKPSLRKELLGKPDASNAIQTTRLVFFETLKSYTECPIYDRQRLTPGNLIEGPAIIEQYDATAVVSPRWNGFVGEYGELTLTMDDR